MDVNLTVSMNFSCTLTEKVPSSLNERQRLAIFHIMTAFIILFISLRWKITLLKQRGLCELSEIAEILSNSFQVVHLSLLDCMKTQEPWTNCQGS